MFLPTSYYDYNVFIFIDNKLSFFKKVLKCIFFGQLLYGRY